MAESPTEREESSQIAPSVGWSDHIFSRTLRPPRFLGTDKTPRSADLGICHRKSGQAVQISDKQVRIETFVSRMFADFADLGG